MVSGSSIVAVQMEPQELGVYFGGTVMPPKEEAPEGGAWVAKHEMTGWSVIKTRDTTFADRFIKDNAEDFDGLFLASTVLYDTNKSWLASYYDGECTWSVAHDGSSGDKYHLEIDGDPPSLLDAIEGEYHALLDEQEDGDPTDWGLEIPDALLEALIGMSHDGELCAPEVLAYYELRRAE